jgi:hypothetical protein
MVIAKLRVGERLTSHAGFNPLRRIGQGYPFTITAGLVNLMGEF